MHRADLHVTRLFYESLMCSEHQSSEALGSLQDKWSTWHRSAAHPAVAWSPRCTWCKPAASAALLPQSLNCFRVLLHILGLSVSFQQASWVSSDWLLFFKFPVNFYAWPASHTNTSMWECSIFVLFPRQVDFKVETDRTWVKLSKWSNSRRKSGSLEARSRCSL